MKLIDPNFFAGPNLFAFNMRRKDPIDERDSVRVANGGPKVVTLEIRRGKMLSHAQFDPAMARSIAAALIAEADAMEKA